MPTDQEKLDYLNEIVRTRGYAHGSHRLLANHDLDALKAVNDVTLANYIPARSLSAADKELLLVGAFTALRSAPVIIRAHVQKSLKAGADLRQSLATIERCWKPAAARSTRVLTPGGRSPPLQRRIPRHMSPRHTQTKAHP